MTLKGKRLTRKETDKSNKTLLKVPNTKAGERFLADLHKYSVMGVRIAIRGRGSRKQAREQSSSSRKGMLSRYALNQDLPREFADHFAVYLRKPELERVEHEQHMRSVDYWVGKEREKTQAVQAQLDAARGAIQTLVLL